MIQIYTGDGKGKSTAGFGLVLRALGADLTAHVVQFGKTEPSGEGNLLLRTGLCPVANFWAKGFLRPDDDVQPFRKMVIEGLTYVEKLLQSENKPDVLLLDEINVCLDLKLIRQSEMQIILDQSKDIELILTGRNAPDWLIEKADLVTEMKKIKHYFDKKQVARKGIEF